MVRLQMFINVINKIRFFLILNICFPTQITKNGVNNYNNNKQKSSRSNLILKKNVKEIIGKTPKLKRKDRQVQN